MEEDKKINYISLIDAARLCSYSEPYLRLRARQGKLKSIKLGKKWMTTVAWLDDYERRVAVWRQTAEAKKEAAARAVFVVAPEEITNVVDQTPPSNILDAYPVLAENERLLPPPMPKRRLASKFGGQVFPIPREKPVHNGLNRGGLAALLSGALAALLFFAVSDSGQLINVIPSSLGDIGQADVSKTIAQDKIENLPFSTEAVGQDALSMLVDIIADFFE